MEQDRIRSIAMDAARYAANHITGCWHWLGARLKSGHGVVRVGRTMQLAHRVFYLWFVGPIAAGLLAHHTCHNPACVNPHHIALVTPREHARIHAELHGKLDYTKAAEIRRLWRETELNQGQIAALFGVDHSTVSLVIRGKTWIMQLIDADEAIDRAA